MPSDVAGEGLQAHHYSDGKCILLISVYFLPLPPRLFLLYVQLALSLHPRGESSKDLYFLCASLTLSIFLCFVVAFSFLLSP